MFRSPLQCNMEFGEPHLQLAVVGRGYVVERFWDTLYWPFAVREVKIMSEFMDTPLEG